MGTFAVWGDGAAASEIVRGGEFDADAVETAKRHGFATDGDRWAVVVECDEGELDAETRFDAAVKGFCRLAEVEISDDEIRGLLSAAGEAYDTEQVEICRKALDGDAGARASCAKTILAWTLERADLDLQRCAKRSIAAQRAAVETAGVGLPMAAAIDKIAASEMDLRGIKGAWERAKAARSIHELRAAIEDARRIAARWGDDTLETEALEAIQ